MTLTQVEPPQAAPDDAFDLTRNLHNLYTLARDRKQQLTDTWRRNTLLVKNRQYNTDLRQPWSSNVTDSEIFPILSARIGWLLDQKLSFEIAPATTPGSVFFQYMSTLGEHLQQILDTNYVVLQWDKQVVLACWDAAQYGAGIFKVGWDSGLDAGLGNAVLQRIDPWSFYPDPNATSLDDMQYCFEVKKMTYAEIERRFPSTSAALIAEVMDEGDAGDGDSMRPQPSYAAPYPMANPGNLPGAASTSWGLPGQSRRYASNLLENGVNVYECWIRENYREEAEPTDPTHGTNDEEVVFDQWRVVVYSGNHVLLDELAVNLWELDRHPYERFVDEETGDFWPEAITYHLAPMQIAINRLLSSIQGNAELIGNPIFMDVAGSGIARTQIMNRPGLRVQKSNSTAASGSAQPGWLQPPPLPDYVLSTVQFWIGRMENVSGLSGPQKGQPTSGRPAQQTVQATQEAGFVRIRSALRNLERTLGSAGNLLAQIIIQNYDVPRVVAVIGDSGIDTAIRLAARHFYEPSVDKKTGKISGVPMKYSIAVRCGSSAPTSRQARIAEADALKALGAIDNQAVLEAHAWPNWPAVVQRMQAAAAAAQQAAIAAGQTRGGPKPQPTGPGTGHPH